MSKPGKSSWLPKGGKSYRSAVSGQFVQAGNRAGKAPATTVVSTYKGSAPPSKGSGYTVSAGKPSFSRTISLPNGGILTSVRGDVMDRALGRGPFKDKK